MAASIFLLYMTAFSLLQYASSSSLCHRDSALFLYSLKSQCPLSISPNPPLQVDGSYVEGVLSRKQRIGYISVLFYASWCPFSQSVLPKLETLSSIFPQVEHLVVEQSSTLPSVFSRYGIHSVPAILLLNQTSIIRYHGSKDLLSLVQFYERNTGFGPIHYFADDQQDSLSSDKKSAIKSLVSLSPKEICSGEPYLIFSVLFLCLRILLYVLPGTVAHLRAFLVSHVPHLNLQVFGETSQMMGRILQVIDVRRIGTKLRLSKTRSFHQRAKSARVWASSLASVSLGEASSARTSS
ncbi:5'-adenylylsulfate reductase-like 5 [Neltuma alba]|uniref:5'-adenylylsulfate reductase-like 5 n=1 Tax=Neltuma alba TaxID=207710 RepID=UPI0010A2FA44|nr:5'-adenylylsulfate reductase-like 5 [Prosopis alba]XP_028790367.1 5'-adenylylsulfate reductase-like 5 [Prosopis alba]